MSTDKVIIMFKDGVSQDQIKEYISQINNGGGEVTQTYGALIPGFAAKVTPDQLTTFQSLSGDIIASIEPDTVVTIQ
ncbi:hypothetical protein BDZ89DRAFT_1162022 [Hymenopellis radicata]|nr:hypothetical protein BDZ89DRAFT_1162022 [Hymenopellis radicata]